MGLGGSNEDPVTIKTNGNGVLKLETGGSSKAIEIIPNGTGKIIMYEAYNEATPKGAEFEVDANGKVDLSISGKLTVDGLIDPTGLILDNHDGSDLTTSNGLTGSKLGIYNSNGTLKFKFNNGGNIETHEILSISILHQYI